MDDENNIIPISPAAKTINNYLEKSFDFSRDGEADGGQGLWGDETRSVIDSSTLKHLFHSEDWVFLMIDLIALKVASQPLRINREIIAGDGSSDINQVPGHSLQSIIENPNPFQDYTAWMYNTVVEDANQGNALVWYGEASNTLMTMPADKVVPKIGDPQRGEHGVIGYYLQTAREDQPGALAARDSERVAFFPAEEIAHIMRPNPSSLLWGLSPLVPAQKVVLFNRFTTDYLNAFYQKQATPGMIITVDRNANEDVLLRMLRSFETAYNGRRNARRNMVLPKGTEARAVSHSIADQRLIETVGMNRETLIAIYKIPKHEVGLADAGSIGSEEAKLALKNFWESQLIPTQRRIAGKLTQFFRMKNLLAPNEFLEFDNSNVSALQDDMLKKAQMAQAMLQAGLSINEVRRDVWSESPSLEESADKPFLISSQPQNPFMLATGASEEKEDVVTIDPDDVENQKVVLPQKYKKFNDMVQKQFDEELGTTAKTIENLVIDVLLGMVDRAVQVAADVLVEKGSKPLRIKEADLPSRKELRKQLREAILELEDAYVDETTDRLEASINIGYDQQLTFVFDEQNVQQLEVLKGQGAGGRRAILEERGLKTFKNISETMTDRIMKTIGEGVEGGKTIDQITGDIIDTVGTRETLLSKANTVARTETLTAISIGQNGAMQAMKEVFPEGLKKSWLTAADERVRDTHLDNQSEGAIDVDEKFSNGLAYPREPGGSAGETINCRCTLITIPPGEEESLGFDGDE